jgi:hypothetical protein
LGVEARRKRQGEELLKFEEGLRPDKPPPLPPNPLTDLEEKISMIIGRRARVSGYSDKNVLVLEFAVGNDAYIAPLLLSDGEKQLLLISLFLLGQIEARFAFLVDEPELYLNEALAIRTWEAVEKCFPKAVFLYATHSPAFATRSTVEETYVIGMDRRVERLDRRVPVPASVLREIVSTRVQLLRTDARPLFCEDVLAELILSDLFPPNQVLPVRLSNWETVVSATRRVRGWEMVTAGGPPCCGVIDRDARDDEEVEKLRQIGVVCFPLYEAESLLLDPKVAIWSLSMSGLKVAEADYVDLLVRCAEERRDITLKKIAQHISWSHRDEELIRFEPGPAGLISVSLAPLGDEPKNIFSDRAAKLYAAVASRDIQAILKLFKGKCMYRTLQRLLRDERKFALHDAKQRYMDIRSFKGFEQIVGGVEWLTALKVRIEGRLAS